MIVYGSRVSYYTGKLEAYLRYKGIAYQSAPTPYGKPQRLIDNVGVIQMPIVECGDGRWMSDTTPILLQLEKEHPGSTIMPGNPVVNFIARLIEDYGDEWLWRSAMHFRWSYPYDRMLISNVLVDEVTQDVPAPRFLKRRRIERRQVKSYVERDGVTASTRPHVEQGYHRALANMTQMLATRSFLLGDAPSLADYGMMGPMFRHFGQDPTPVEIMRTTAPTVFEWVARMWNAKPAAQQNFVDTVPDDAEPMLKEICETHLVQLAANAEGYAAGQDRFAMTVQGCNYQDIATSRYRVWCLEKLHKAFAALSSDDQQAVRDLLPYPEAEILWCEDTPAQSGYDPENRLPFGKAINVFAGGTP
ncbi:glutathione S-transferase family protein [Alterisphingorhabdus coralli]|uniref:Glutathione S-transferase family protein n=1 Tax=Alterisphingorhabdus coralli TaxID=3071408 RepID=A0AA97F9M3_9SPHN|nr:glutathione S-transferase family protein [Parasphingorhabdus sp. SCSIO 66989]WOE75802.1 glutathione S-transferase family protein [Parasphingorhabdus sp. SCSIO 66989]